MQIPEVAAYKSEVRIVYDVPFGIFILVETKQSSTVAQAGEYLGNGRRRRMSRLHTFRPDGYSFRQRLASTVPEYDMSFLLSFFFHYNRSITLRTYRLSLLLPLPGFPLLKYLAALR